MSNIDYIVKCTKEAAEKGKARGDYILAMPIDSANALIEAMEKAQQQNKSDFEIKARLCNESNSLHDRLREAEKRIAELEESHAQAIQSRDHYKRISEEGLKQLAESCAVSAESFTCPRCGRTTTHPEGWHYCHKREAE